MRSFSPTAPAPFNSVGFFTFLRTYARRHHEDDANSTIESWTETLTRCLNACETQLKVGFTDDEAKEVFDDLYNLRCSIAGRFLWQLGTHTVDIAGLTSLQNCFKSTTTFWTDKGIKSFEDFKDGEAVVIRGKNMWKDATVHSFGVQKLMKLTAKHWNTTEEIYVTPEHRWFAKTSKGCGWKLTETKDLKEGLILQHFSKRTNFNMIQICPVGIQHGIVFGDGHTCSNIKCCAITLCGVKKELLSPFFFTPRKDNNMITGLPSTWKTLPSIEMNKEYLFGFLAGWFATDGSICVENQLRISNKDKEVLEWARGAFSILDITTSKVTMFRETNPFNGEYAPCYNIRIYSQDIIPESFFIRKDHKEKFVMAKSFGWKVHSVEETDLEEEVWCVTEPEEKCFTLECGILTHNCCYVTIDDSIIPFTWAMNFLMCGGGVGYRLLPEDIEKLDVVLPAVIKRQDTKDADFIVPDSREGWVKLLEKTLKSRFCSGKSFTYSCILLRSKGAPIKGFGGVASGPEALCEGITNINRVLDKHIGKKIRPIDALDIMNIIGSIVVAGNVRRCYHENALIHCRKGLMKTTELTVGDEVLTSQGYRRIKNIFNQGRQNVIVIKTQDGEFKCTPNHRMAVLTSPDKYEWKEASSLISGDRLITPRVSIEGEETYLPEWTYDKPLFSTTCKDIIVPELDEDMAWFIGVFQGDGYTYPNYKKNGFNAYICLVFGLNELKLAERIRKQIMRFGQELHVTVEKRNGENSYIVRCQSKQLSWYLDKNIKQAKIEIKVPPFILRSKQSIKMAYVAGLIDSDGCVSGRPIQIMSSVYRSHIEDVQKLLYSCGIESRLHIGKLGIPSRKGWQLLHTLDIITLHSQRLISEIPQLFKKFEVRTKSQSANGFPSKFILDSLIRKKCGLTPLNQINIDRYTQLVKNIEHCPTEVVSIIDNNEVCQTYDIEVEDNHEFFCDGYLIHNSAQIAIGDCKDIDYLRAKRWDLGNVENWRANSNNSVICNDINDILENEEFWEGYNGNGEPYGLINLDLHRKCGRIGETQYPDEKVDGCNPCSEQSLESHESCCLSELYLPHIKTKEDLFRCARNMYRICKHSLTLPCPHSKETEEVVHRNMRMGIGVTGYLQATEEQRSWLSSCYEYLRRFDLEYSQKHNFPPSIKLSCIKPSGSLSLLAGVTSGIHPAYSQYYIRRVRIASDSPLVKVVREHGYHVEPVKKFDGTLDHTTSVIEFPYSFPDGTVVAENFTAVQQLEVVKRAQTEWSDNAVSVTVTYKPEELPEIKEWLRKNYNDNIKSVSFLLHSGHGFIQAPIEPITKERYLQIVATTRKIENVEGICYRKEEEILDAECAGGACPIK